MLFWALIFVDVDTSYRETLSEALKTNLGIAETVVVAYFIHRRVQNQTTGSFHIHHFRNPQKSPTANRRAKENLKAV